MVIDFLRGYTAEHHMALAQLLLQTPMELVRQEIETQLITSIQILIAILIFMELVLAVAVLALVVALETVLQVDSVIVLMLTYLMLAVLALVHLGLELAEITTQAELIR